MEALRTKYEATFNCCQCRSQRQNLTEAGARLQIKCVFYFISVMPLSSVNPMFDRLLESSHRDDSNKWSNIGFTEEITQVVAIEFIYLFL